MVVYLFAKGAEIVEAKYQTTGCPSARACGEWLCAAVVGMRFDAVAAVSEADVASGVGGLPMGREFCAGLAAGALAAAVKDLERPAE